MYEEILTYNEILEYIAKNEEQDDNQAIIWKFHPKAVIPDTMDPSSMSL